MSLSDKFVETIKKEVIRRTNASKAIEQAMKGDLTALMQFAHLDEMFSLQVIPSIAILEAVYLESRHYIGNHPHVYSMQEMNRFPFFGGTTDDDCNPFFSISAIKSKLSDGIAPIKPSINKEGGPGVGRKRTYPHEADIRATALAALNAYPDTTNESLSLPPSAPTILTNALVPWRDKAQLASDNQYILATQTYLNPANSLNRTASQWWLDLVAEINNCISLLPSSPIPPALTPPASGALATSINTLILYANTYVDPFVDARRNDLNRISEEHEDKVFDIMKLRLHQVNGSFAKMMALKTKNNNSTGLLEDNKSALKTLSSMITKKGI